MASGAFHMSGRLRMETLFRDSMMRMPSLRTTHAMNTDEIVCSLLLSYIVLA